MNRDDFAKLLTPSAQELLNSTELDSKADVVKTVSKLRNAGLDAGLVAAVLTQAKLRKRASSKFGEFTKSMLFTEAALEQASRLQVSAQHAGRFKSAGINQVADLGCGIGAESMAFASLGINVVAVEIDEVTAACATYNLAPFDNADVIKADVTELDLSGFEAQFFDPARRDGGRRKFDPNQFSPKYDWVIDQARLRPTGVKLGPGHPHEAIPDDAEAQWISVDGDLVELTLWFGSLARDGVKRSALLLTNDRRHELNSDSKVQDHAEIRELGAYVFEPDNAVIRSHLIGVLAGQLDLGLVSAEIAYLTGNTPIESPWVRGFKVLENLTFDRKKLKARLAELEIGTLEIKKRGSDVVPEALRKELKLKGKRAATLIITRIGDSHRALLCEPI